MPSDAPWIQARQVRTFCCCTLCSLGFAMINTRLSTKMNIKDHKDPQISFPFLSETMQKGILKLVPLFLFFVSTSIKWIKEDLKIQSKAQNRSSVTTTGCFEEVPAKQTRDPDPLSCALSSKNKTSGTLGALKAPNTTSKNLCDNSGPRGRCPPCVLSSRYRPSLRGRRGTSGAHTSAELHSSPLIRHRYRSAFVDRGGPPLSLPPPRPGRLATDDPA
jgi:hypothetical protein